VIESHTEHCRRIGWNEGSDLASGNAQEAQLRLRQNDQQAETTAMQAVFAQGPAQVER